MESFQHHLHTKHTHTQKTFEGGKNIMQLAHTRRKKIVLNEGVEEIMSTPNPPTLLPEVKRLTH